jgi:small conductance mechanosensitive channel
MANIPLPDVLEPWADLLVAASKALFIFVLGWFASKWAHAIAGRVFVGRRIDAAVARFLASLTQYAVLAAAFIAALEAVGVATTSFVAILGSAALAVGLALQGSLANFASGVMLLVFRPFTIGDLITVVAKTGTVEEIGLFATTILTADNHKVIIPNAQVMSGPIENLTVSGTRRGKIDITVAAGNDPQHVIDVLQSTAATVDGVVDEPAPQVSMWAKAADWAATASRARLALLDALAKENIALA